MNCDKQSRIFKMVFPFQTRRSLNFSVALLPFSEPGRLENLPQHLLIDPNSATTGEKSACLARIPDPHHGHGGLWRRHLPNLPTRLRRQEIPSLNNELAWCSIREECSRIKSFCAFHFVSENSESPQIGFPLYPALASLVQSKIIKVVH